MMQVIPTDPVSPNQSEILFKYDVGQITGLSQNGKSKTVKISSESKKFIFNNSKSLSEKLIMIEDMVTNPPEESTKTPVKKFDGREISYNTHKFDTTANEKSICGFTPNSKIKISQTQSIRKQRYKPAKALASHQSLGFTPFKEFTSKGSCSANYTANQNPTFLSRVKNEPSTTKSAMKKGLPPTWNSDMKRPKRGHKYSQHIISKPSRTRTNDISTMTFTSIRSQRNYSKSRDRDVFRRRR